MANSLTRSLARRLDTSPPLPGFNGRVYLAINDDVAAQPGVDPHAHYRSHGHRELRTLMMPGYGIDHPKSRMLNGAERADWLDAVKQRGLEAAIAQHPRAAWLKTGFTLAGYLMERPRIASEVDEPRQAAFHFLEFGLEDGFAGRPAGWDRDYVKARYGLEFDEGTGVTTVLLALLKKHSPLDIVLDEAQMWELEGLSGQDMPRLFDHEHYHAMAHRAGRAPKRFDRATC
ncbi:MAG: hypothetical protein RIG84_09630, partial [Roseovarius sp.]